MQVFNRETHKKPNILANLANHFGVEEVEVTPIINEVKSFSHCWLAQFPVA